MSQLSSVTTGLQGQIGGLQTRIEENQREARAGTALALAASGLRYDDRPGKVSIAAAAASYKGLSGIAAGLGYTATRDFRFNAAVSASPQLGDYGVTMGAAWTLN